MYKVIEGHNNMYSIGDDGTVINNKTGKKLKAVKSGSGYYHITLCYGRKENVLIHRLVAKAYISNPDNLPIVNHKDENKGNNSANNLEWCTQKYNANYGKGAMVKNSPIIQKDIEGNIIRRWASIKEAAENLNLKYQVISRVCRKIRKTSGGFCWEYDNKG